MNFVITTNLADLKDLITNVMAAIDKINNFEIKVVSTEITDNKAGDISQTETQPQE